MIAPRISVGLRPHRVTLHTLGDPVPDAGGGYTQPIQPLDPPAVFARLEPATGADAERVSAGSTLTHNSFVVTIPYHPQVTTEAFLVFNGRVFTISGVANPEERNAELVLVCDELVAP